MNGLVLRCHFEPLEYFVPQEIQGEEDDDPGDSHQHPALCSEIVNDRIEGRLAPLAFVGPVVLVAVLDVGVDDHVGRLLVN